MVQPFEPLTYIFVSINGCVRVEHAFVTILSSRINVLGFGF